MSIDRSWFVLACALVATACGRAPRPTLVPTPRLAARAAHVVETPREQVELPPGVVAARVTAMFGSSLTAPAGAMPATGPSWDIDVRSYETNARVAHYVALFSGPARDRMAQRIERGTRYDAMIRAKLRQSGLPEDLTYIALIESGYYPHAYSRAAAVGMWQLMAETARDGGLRVDGWVDERRDPVRSTDAAIRFLRWLHGEFGSVYLAAAAYNGGPGRLSRGLTRFAPDLEESTGDGFFTLAAQEYLPRETKEYVPQLIAAALVAKDPERYGIHVTPLPAFAYDSVRVPALTPLAAVAAASGAPLAEILELNPHLLRGLVPPAGGTLVRVPVGRAEGFDAAFAALSESERRGVARVTTKKKQTLADLARATGRSTRVLAAFNPGLAYTKKKLLVPGQTVLVPTAAVAAATRDVPDAEAGRAPAKPASPSVAAKSARTEPVAKGASGSPKRSAANAASRPVKPKPAAAGAAKNKKGATAKAAPKAPKASAAPRAKRA